MGKVSRTESKESTSRAQSIAQIEAEIVKIKADPELSFLFHTMTGLTSLKTLGTTSSTKQLLVAMGLLDALFEEGYSDLAPALIILGTVLATRLEAEAEAEKDRAVRIDSKERKLN